jgi:carboxypeptidase Taq
MDAQRSQPDAGPHSEARTELLMRLQEVNDLSSAGAVLGWDQSTYMPPGGGAARGRQVATLTRLAHERFTDPTIGHLLDKLTPYAEDLPYEHNDAALIRVTRREYERAMRVPADFMARVAAHTAVTYGTWSQARPANDFARVIPALEETLRLSRAYADYFPGYEHIADPLIDRYDTGMTAGEIGPLFAELRNKLSNMVRAIGQQPPIDAAILHQHYPEIAQHDFGVEVIRQIGYDFDRGRQDISPHPFTTNFSIGDVRITTRFNEYDLNEGLFSTLHECGHAVYEQGIDPLLEGTPLAQGTSAGVHESQSRLWENLVGRGRNFWQHYYPQLQACFPEQLGNVAMEEFYRAINKVERSLIRTDADEVTYDLHVIIRFGLELDLLEGQLAVADLAEAWHERYEEALGVRAPTDENGVLQDVHWYGGLIGGSFQGYTLGNIMASQLMDAALRANPAIPDEIARGDFAPLHAWLRANIYHHGSKFTAAELLERVTGGSLKLEPYLHYLTAKFGDLYPGI